MENNTEKSDGIEEELEYGSIFEDNKKEIDIDDLDFNIKKRNDYEF